MLSIAAAALSFSVPINTKVAAASAAAALTIVASPAFAGDAKAGEAVFSGNCAACHAGGQNVIMPDKTLELAAQLGAKQRTRHTRTAHARAMRAFLKAMCARDAREMLTRCSRDDHEMLTR